MCAKKKFGFFVKPACQGKHGCHIFTSVNVCSCGVLMHLCVHLSVQTRIPVFMYGFQKII